MTNDTIAFAANLALTLSVIIALEALRNFQTREFVELLQYVNAHRLPATYQEMRGLPALDQTFLIQFAQQMESLGILVADKYISLDLVERTLKLD